MPSSFPQSHEHLVSQAESGMKLITFIQRRLSTPVPLSMVHKWIRSGQVRVNKKRAKPFQRLAAGESVRIPPFADLREQDTAPDALLDIQRLALPIVFTDGRVLVINKPAGLAVQPGSGLDDSVVQRLRQAYAQNPFIPAPAHRLDKNTSGLLAIGLDHASLAGLSQWFATPEHSHKHYLAWVDGSWPQTAWPREATGAAEEDGAAKVDGAFGLAGTIGTIGTIGMGGMGGTGGTGGMGGMGGAYGTGLTAESTGRGKIPVSEEHAEAILEDYLYKSRTGKQNMQCVDKKEPGALFARSRVLLLARTMYNGSPASLLRVILETGRTHQIRAQLSARGFPVMGDVRYGGKPHTPMLLHAYELGLPGHEPIRCLPSWPAPFKVSPSLAYGQTV